MTGNVFFLATAGGRLTTPIKRLIICFAVIVSLVGVQPAWSDSVGEAPALWRIESPSNTVYFLGSVHLLTDAERWLDARIQEAFQSAEILVLEADLDAAATPEMQAFILSRALYPQGDGLHLHLDQVLYAQVLEQATELGLPAAAVDRFKPWYISLVMTVKVLEQQGFSSAHGVDQVFNAKARARSMQVIGLETVKEQIGFLIDSLSGHEEVVVRDTLRQISQAGDLVKQMTTAWLNGDTVALEALLLEQIMSVPEYYETLFLHRNQNWLRDIEGMLGSDDDYFVVVGAGHLVGDGSLIDLLKQRGHQVERY